MTTYLIVGNGIAANTAAENIRGLDESGEILMFSKERCNFYYLPALPEYIAGEKSIAQMTIHDDAWYRRKQIALHLDCEISAIDDKNRRVISRDGTAHRYDKLLLATGGVSFVPPIAGVSARGVYTLRTVDDARAIKERAERSKKMVLIGGGLLGLEAGNGLRKLGLTVSVVEFFPRLLPRQMDEAGAAMLQRKMEDMGFRFRLGVKTKEIVSEKEGLRVCLEGGEVLDADLVLLSAGVRPEMTLARALGIDGDKGVPVDDNMKTEIDGIYAAGDLVEHRGRNYGIWPASQEQGRVAGLTMAGGHARYEGTMPSNTLKVVGIDLFSAGDIDPEGENEAVVFQDATIYRKFVMKEGVLIGAIVFGDARGSEEILQALLQKKNIASLVRELGNRDFDFSRLN